MNISELIKNLAIIDNDLNVSGLALNSKKVSQHDVFIALSGASHHGLTYAKSAVEKGAVAVLFDSSDNELAQKHLAVSF